MKVEIFLKQHYRYLPRISRAITWSNWNVDERKVDINIELLQEIYLDRFLLGRIIVQREFAEFAFCRMTHQNVHAHLEVLPQEMDLRKYIKLLFVWENV